MNKANFNKYFISANKVNAENLMKDAKLFNYACVILGKTLCKEILTKSKAYYPKQIEQKMEVNIQPHEHFIKEDVLAYRDVKSHLTTLGIPVVKSDEVFFELISNNHLTWNEALKVNRNRLDDYTFKQQISKARRLGILIDKKIPKNSLLIGLPKRLTKQENKKNLLETKINEFINMGYKKIGSRYFMNDRGLVYKISSLDLIEVVRSKRIPTGGNEYYGVSIDAKNIYLHILFAENFISNPNNYKYVSAKNGNLLDISLENICWVPYPAYRRVADTIIDESKWLGWIIANFLEGIQMQDELSYLTNLLNNSDLNKLKNNENPKSTIETVIRNYLTHDYDEKRFFKLDSDNNIHLDYEKINNF